MRDWARARRERTRHLIELGGLVQKAGLVELTNDDRATILGVISATEQFDGLETDRHKHFKRIPNGSRIPFSRMVF